MVVTGSTFVHVLTYIRDRRLGLCNHYLGLCDHLLGVRNHCFGIRNCHVGVDSQFGLEENRKVRECPKQPIERTLKT